MGLASRESLLQVRVQIAQHNSLIIDLKADQMCWEVKRGNHDVMRVHHG